MAAHAGSSKEAFGLAVFTCVPYQETKVTTGSLGLGLRAGCTLQLHLSHEDQESQGQVMSFTSP